ncbi:hypothetical protein CEXT_392891 [Caerostris extrusa]|uniref:Transposase n=1 Tax=Caerostris extrusa TaxID=172846 RepID=A0AAV4T8F4_CAEEX|nr:hypothetical protein CEXT_392891 [Caerostris extrusa]
MANISLKHIHLAIIFESTDLSTSRMNNSCFVVEALKTSEHLFRQRWPAIAIMDTTKHSWQKGRKTISDYSAQTSRSAKSLKKRILAF